MPDRDPAQALLELQALQRVAEDMVSSRDLDDVLARCIDHMREMARTSSGAIYLRDERRGVFRRLISRDTAHTQAHLPVAQIDAALTGRSYFIVDLDDARHAWHPGVQAARERGFRIVLNFGMRWRGRLIGLLLLAWRERVTIPESTLRTLEAVTGYQAAAIENARTLQLAERRATLAQLLRDFSRRALTAPDEAALERLTVETAQAIGQGAGAALVRVDGAATSLLAGTLLPAPAADDPLLAAALPRREPTAFEDLVTAPASSALAAAAREHGCASLVLAPLRPSGGGATVVIVASPASHAWGGEELDALEMLAAMAADALERDSARAAEARERHRLDATLEHLPMGVVVIDGNGRMLHGNRAAREMGALLGSTETTYQASVRKVHRPDGTTYEMKDSIMAPALRGEMPPPRDVKVVDGDGRPRVIRAVAAPLHAPGEPPVAVLGFSDVTELFELAAAKDRFLRIASHELRSPVTALRATAQLFALDPTVGDDEERRRALTARMDRQSARLVKLVAQLLDWARLQADALPLELEEVELTSVAREAAEAAGPRVRVVAAGPLVGRWDGSRIEQVLTNLLTNALQYSPAEAPVELRLHDAGEHVRIEVEDRGDGIPADQLPQLFTPFFRARPTAERHRTGLGLGLHITSEIVRRHGGTIAVRSTPGAGSTFVVELPR